jgi:hypothetical protein
VTPYVRARRFYIAITLLGLVAAAVVLGACSGSDPAPTTTVGDVKTYTDDMYGFSFDYPADWTVQPSLETQVTAGAAATAGVCAYDPEGTTSDGSYYDFVEVSVYELNATVDDSVLSQVKDEVQTTFAQLESQTGSWEVTSELKDISLAGLKGWTISYSCNVEGTPSQCTFYTLFTGTLEYQLLLHASGQNWDSDEAPFDAFLASFSPGDLSSTTTSR